MAAVVVKIRAAVAVAAGFALLPAPHGRADFTWNGSGDGASFTDPFNWVGTMAPPVGTDLGGQTLIFGPTGAAQMPDVLGGSYLGIGAITFTNADASLTLSDSGVIGSFSFNDAGTITNDSALCQTVNVDLVGTGSSFFLMAPSGDLDVGGDIDLSDSSGVQLGVFGDMNTMLQGIISGSGGSVLKQGNGALTLTRANTYDGGTGLAAGTIILGNDSALGTGDLTVTGDSAIQSNDDARIIANNIGLAASTTLTFSGGNNLELGGVISGDGSLAVNTDAGDDTLKLFGDNTYTGGTTLMQGTILMANDNALGTGDLNVTGDGTIQSDQDNRTITNAINIADMTNLTFSGASSLGLNGVISGDGKLIVNGDAPGLELRLEGDNTYTGGTTLMQGTLALGANTALGTGDLTLAGDGTIRTIGTSRQIANNIILDTFTLTFSGGNPLELDGVLSGMGGSLVINADQDATSLTLRGDNTYDGGTTLTQGTLILGHNNALGTGGLTLGGAATIQSDDDSVGVANAIDNGSFLLTFSGDRDLLLSGDISGAGGLTIDVNATLTLSSLTNSYTGATDIQNGTLNLQGFIDSDVTIDDGGTFIGTGTMDGDLTVKSGGTVSPGDSIGMLTVVNGNVVLDNGGTMLVELSADDLTSDLLDVSGTANLAAGSTIMADVTGSTYIRSGQPFTIIQAGAGVFDAGANITSDSVAVTVDLVRDQAFMDGDMAYALQLLRASDAYSAAANPGNNRQIGTGLDSTIPTANADPTGPAGDLLASLDGLDATAYNATVAQLSPEPYNAVKTTGNQAVRDFTTQQAAYFAGRRSGLETWPASAPVPGPPPGSMVLAQDDPLLLSAAIAQAEHVDAQQARAESSKSDSRWNRYVKLQGIFMDRDTTLNRTGFNAVAVGAQIGVDYSFSRNLLAGAALGYTFTDADLNMGLGNLKDHTIRVGPYTSYTKGNWYVDGSVTWAWHFYDGDRNIPALGLTANADYNGWDLTAYAGTGYHFEVAKDLHLTPRASMLYSYFNFYSFTETGAGGANLTVGSRSAHSLRSRLGGSLAYRLDWHWKPIPYIYAGWEHEYLNDSDIRSSFASGGSPFLINTGSPDRDAFFIGGGVNVLIHPKVAGFFRFEQSLSSNASVSALAVGLSVAF